MLAILMTCGDVIYQGLKQRVCQARFVLEVYFYLLNTCSILDKVLCTNLCSGIIMFSLFLFSLVSVKSDISLTITLDISNVWI